MGGHGEGGRVTVPHDIPSGAANQRNPYAQGSTAKHRAAYQRLRRAPSGFVIWGVFFAMTAFGYYRVTRYNNANSNYLRETREAKMAIFPYRKAEADLLLLGRMNAEAAYEAKIMKDVDGWVPGQSVYTYRWVPPNENLRREINETDL